MKSHLFIFSFLLSIAGASQGFDTSKYRIVVEVSKEENSFFTKDSIWRGADGAASINIGNGKILWLFSDSFICKDTSRSRKKSTIIRNSIAVQDGHDLNVASLKFYWNNSGVEPKAFFDGGGKFWYWTGHGTMINDRLIIFLMKVKEVKEGLGFEAFDWGAVLISNPTADPFKWKMKYLETPNTYGYLAGSAAVLQDETYLYAFGAVEPATHEVYLLRWSKAEAYIGNLSKPQWWLNGQWAARTKKLPAPVPLFIGATEYSVHYDTVLKKFIQVQSFGFGEGKIGMRTSDKLGGPWTEPFLFYTPKYPGVKKPFMYSVKAHPELRAKGMLVTYNVNSFDFGELIDNEEIYFPKFVSVKFEAK